MKHIFTYLLSLSIIYSSMAATEPSDTLSVAVIEVDTFIITEDDPVLLAMDRALTDKYFNINPLICDTNVLDKIGICFDSIPKFNDEYFAEYLSKLNSNTPFDLSYNSKVQAFINLYVDRRRVLTSKLLGMSHVYFPMFEELLDKYELPLEFKYLAVIESALNPVVKSRAGATGLWQFMYSTGKMFDLNVTSYVDDRMDPYKSTEAACRYFKYLYGLYGNWELVMAAYNCGPGNVNKAIRRAGGAKDYWELYPYLPRETRGYVPAFIAVNYAMNNAAAHNIYPVAPLTTYFEYDTVHVKEGVKFSQLSEALDIPLEKIEFLNPRYKIDEVPHNGQPNYIYLPKDKVGLFITNEKMVYNLGKKLLAEQQKEQEEQMEVVETLITHKVKNGEYLGLIAEKYGIGVDEIKKWNNLYSNNLKVGQRLTIYADPKKNISPQKVVQAAKSANVAPEKYYTMQSGDTLWDVAKAKGISYDQLKELNTGTDFKKLKPGDKIVISGM